MVELFINNKKELRIEENKLFKVINMLNFNDGNPTMAQVRTLYGKMKYKYVLY